VGINSVLKDDAVIGFVTDTVWGIGCLPTSKKAVERIYKIKGRDREKPLILMSNNKKYLYPYVKNVSPNASKLMKEYFPGALTLVMEKSNKTPNYITSNKDTVGIRVPDNFIFQEFCSLIDGHVLATTSANLSNQPSAKTYEEAKKSIGHLVDFVFTDEGFCCTGKESTVALVIKDEVKILRQGSVIIDEKTL
jgi:L-threonylcarbamoyladenylate synthase